MLAPGGTRTVGDDGSSDDADDGKDCPAVRFGGKDVRHVTLAEVRRCLEQLVNTAGDRVWLCAMHGASHARATAASGSLRAVWSARRCQQQTSSRSSWQRWRAALGHPLP